MLLAEDMLDTARTFLSYVCANIKILSADYVIRRSSGTYLVSGIKRELRTECANLLTDAPTQ